ncbi:MAG: EVE domain-containing protein [candidate division WOR-3 bacterium]
MRKFRIFIVNDDTWEEHIKVGIAAINDPLTTHPKNKNANAARQAAIAEISGIRPGDILFFNRMASKKHPPELLGIFEATSKPYFDPNPLFTGAKYVDKHLPFRVQFRCIRNFPNPVNMDEIWALRDKGAIWTLQQSRGDAVGVHACVGITKIEGEIIERLFKMNNIIEGPPMVSQYPVAQKNPLPIDFRIDRNGKLHYEPVLMAILLEDFADGKHKEIFGDYDDFIQFVPTGARKEIDILLLKYDGDEILWYQILELKHDKFTMVELQKLISYEKWIIRNRAENPLQVYPVAIASEFNDEVLDFVRRRIDYKDRQIKMIRYYFDKHTKSIKLEEVK